MKKKLTIYLLTAQVNNYNKFSLSKETRTSFYEN